MTVISRPRMGADTLTVALCLSACGGQSATSSVICGKARPLRLQVADSDTATYGAHADEWHQLIDMAKEAEDYIPLHQIEQTACEGDKTDGSDAG